MFPLESIYGPAAFRAFVGQEGISQGLKHTRQDALDAWRDSPIVAKNYEQLIEIVSFIGVMNKRHALFFRGQGRHRDPVPAIFRRRWRSLSGTVHEIPKGPRALNRIWEHLGTQIGNIVREECARFPMPRPATLRMFREAMWAVAQHYELWPTPLIDLTQNLRIAASFALLGEQREGNLYVAALPPSTNSVTYDADQHVVLARLQAVCPPVAKRPHYQDGFLAGRFPFESPTCNAIDSKPRSVSSLSRRLLVRIVLENGPGQGKDDEGSAGSFWSPDFPPMSASSLMPSVDNDPLLRAFLQHADEIDEAMHRICVRGE